MSITLKPIGTKEPVQDSECEAALDRYLGPGFSMDQVWAFREAWKCSGADDLRTKLADAVEALTEVLDDARAEDWPLLERRITQCLARIQEGKDD